MTKLKLQLFCSYPFSFKALPDLKQSHRSKAQKSNQGFKWKFEVSVYVYLIAIVLKKSWCTDDAYLLDCNCLAEIMV
jgi:hypothetical protein